jgi:hypothetical protein
MHTDKKNEKQMIADPAGRTTTQDTYTVMMFSDLASMSLSSSIAEYTNPAPYSFTKPPLVRTSAKRNLFEKNK